MSLRGVITPVPRVCLSASLAAPAPSGSAGTSRRRQGCSHPPRHLPGQAAPSFTTQLRLGGGEGLSPPHDQRVDRVDYGPRQDPYFSPASCRNRITVSSAPNVPSAATPPAASAACLLPPASAVSRPAN